MNQIFTTLLVLFPLITLAQEQQSRESDIFYRLGGGARFRYIQFDRASGGTINPNEEDYSSSSSRFQFDLELNKGEFFQTFFRGINTGDWGGDPEDRNEWTLQQAWANWNVDTFLSLKFGRQPLELGRGLVYGLNDWENLPSFYDGFAMSFDWPTMELELFALKINDLERSSGSVSADPEQNHYVVRLGFKDLSDKVKLAELHFAQINTEAGEEPGTSTVAYEKQRLQRFGLDLELSGIYYEFGTSVSYVVGTEDISAVENKAKQLMADMELRFIWPDFEQLNVWVGAHYDTGDDTPGDGENTQYDGLFYNIHQNAGRLDFFRFGNLTYTRLGFSMNLLSQYSFGAEYFMFQKTQEGGANRLATSILANDFDNGVYVFGNDKDLGQELDIWFAKTFRSGVLVEVGFNWLNPGAALEGTTLVSSSASAPIDKSIYNFYIDVGMFF